MGNLASARRSFLEVGEDLAQIRDRKLYQETHETFESFCREQFGWALRTVYQVIDAAEVTRSIEAEGAPVPANEAQARELAGLEGPIAALVSRTAHERTNGKPRAKDMAQARAEIAPRVPRQRKVTHQPDWQTWAESWSARLASLRDELQAFTDGPTFVEHYAEVTQILGPEVRTFSDVRQAYIDAVNREYARKG